MKTLNEIREYAIGCHKDTNHTYGNGEPYFVHLRMVAKHAASFIHLLPPDLHDTALKTAWTHDVIEDCRQTYNDVKNIAGYEVAEATYALTNEKGKNRAERANAIYYKGILENRVAHFIKICDRLANAEYSKRNGSSMLNAYQKENGYFKTWLHCSEFSVMFDVLDTYLTPN